MDPRLNPYAPGAGTPPPELAGRDDLIERAAVALDRIRSKRPAQSFILYGLRGVGKTVLLNRIRIDAESRGLACINIEVPEERSLPAVLIPSLRSALLRLSRGAALEGYLLRSMRALAGFASVFKLKYHDIEVSIDADPEAGLADSGNLDTDLVDIFRTLGKAADEKSTALVFFIDELQYAPEKQLAPLIAALHNASQEELPITMVAAGLPQLVGKTGHAKSYAERLFEFAPVDRLNADDARAALVVPARDQGVDYTCDAIKEILDNTCGYPYFLQEWGKRSWSVAETSPISLADAKQATTEALAELDASFFRVRFDRLTPAEKRYMRAMAELGPGPHRSGDIAAPLGRMVTSVAPTRNSLIGKGMIYSPAHGDTAFTVPLFDGFMKRIMPEW
ncbi:MAG: ATP-binding protein [Rhodobacteraceae bacterium]|nr:ATP-binding protein [Paracoccaceae bacterium]